MGWCKVLFISLLRPVLQQALGASSWPKALNLLKTLKMRQLCAAKARSKLSPGIQTSLSARHPF